MVLTYSTQFNCVTEFQFMFPFVFFSFTHYCTCSNGQLFCSHSISGWGYT